MKDIEKSIFVETIREYLDEEVAPRCESYHDVDFTAFVDGEDVGESNKVYYQVSGEYYYASECLRRAASPGGKNRYNVIVEVTIKKVERIENADDGDDGEYVQDVTQRFRPILERELSSHEEVFSED